MIHIAALLIAVTVGSIAVPEASTPPAGSREFPPQLLVEEPIAPDLTYGDRGPWVARLNAALIDAGFRPDGGDEFGKQTRHAVYAFQKHWNLETDGVFRPGMWHLLDAPITLPRRAEANRVEVDLGKQVLYVVEDHAVVNVIPISSANGDTYRSSNGRLATARTPEGVFSFQRKIDGNRRSYLGTLYNPYYFRGGYAIHGSPSVPNHPASHGCIRVTFWDMDYLKTKFVIGETLYIYGQRTEPPRGVELPTPNAVLASLAR